MSGTASTSLAIGSSRDGAYGSSYRPPFTAGQWQELEHQAMIYKYLVAGVPVPPDLVVPIRHSFDAISPRLFHHPSLGYVSYYGKKFDPEPGRCRRTDGKKWRCSKDAHPDSKYCERHMHRGRNRSRKPVESQSTSQSLPTAMTHISNGSATNTISFQGSASGSFQNMPLYSAAGSEGSSYGGSFPKLQMDNLPYGIDSKELRYIPGLACETDDHTFASEASSGVGSLGLGFGAGTNSWRLMPSQVSSNSLLNSKADSLLLSSSSTQQNLAHAFDPMDSKQRQQHCFLGNDIIPGKEEQHPFFNKWPPSMKESWSVDVDDGTDKNSFSSTQLSISIPRGTSDFSSGNNYSQNGEFPNSS